MWWLVLKIIPFRKISAPKSPSMWPKCGFCSSKFLRFQKFPRNPVIWKRKAPASVRASLSLIGCENPEVRLWNNHLFQGYSVRLKSFGTKDNPMNWYPVKRAAFRQFRIVYVRHLCCTYPSYMCAHTTFIYWCISLIASSFTREWAREAYVNNVYSIFLYSWFSTEKACASLSECLIWEVKSGCLSASRRLMPDFWWDSLKV